MLAADATLPFATTLEGRVQHQRCSGCLLDNRQITCRRPRECRLRRGRRYQSPKNTEPPALNIASPAFPEDP